MENPWKTIPLSDYEAHMRLDSVRQLQTLNRMMREQFRASPAESIMILGIAGGNGLEHIDPTAFDAIYAVDVNPDYLRETENRFPGLRKILRCICADLTAEITALPHADLVIADLLIEYIGYAHFQRVLRQTQPAHVSCVIQINQDEAAWVSDSPYLHAFDGLDTVHCQMEEAALNAAMEAAGFRAVFRAAEPLPNGKSLLRLDYETNRRHS